MSVKNNFYRESVNPTFRWPERPSAVPKFRKEPFKEEDRDEPCDPKSENVFKLTDSEMAMFNTKSNIYGNKTKMTNISSTPQETSYNYVGTVNYDRKPMKLKVIKEEDVNESSNTFKYGEHFKGDNSMTSDLKLILRGVMDRKVENTRGPPRGSAGVWSGNIGEKMQL